MSSEEQAEPPQTSPEEAPAPAQEWGEDISPDKDGKLFKKIITPGSGSEKPYTGNEVFVHYTGRLLNGEVFDSSVERNEKFKFKLGQSQVIKGWDVGVATMTRGEKCLLTCTPEYAYGSAGSPPKIGPDETLQFEVELFDWRGEDVTGDGGVIKNILTKGDTHSTPEDGTSVEVHIRGTYEGKTFYEDDVTFDFGEGIEKGVVSGLEQAIGTMHMKETARIFIKPQYAYGEEGNVEFGIPGGAELTYDVRLNNFTKAKDPWDYDNLEERLADASQLKERGGKYFKEGKYALAKKLYNRGAELITDTSIRKEETKAEARPMRVALHSNLAACHLKLQEPHDALKECEEVLADESDNVKAFFRRGQAHQMLQNFEEAAAAFQKVLSIEPTNKAAQSQLTQTRNRMKVLREREKKRYANMFEKFAAKGSDEDKMQEEPPAKPEEAVNGKEEEPQTEPMEES